MWVEQIITPALAYNVHLGTPARKTLEDRGRQDPVKTEDAKTLTIFTPTYNRGYIIGELYRSLLAQTCRDFCWLVVDDGSTDDTAELIASFAREGKIEITYLRQENGGKQRAHNAGVAACATELFFCVDSDDTLTPTAVEDVLELWARRRSDPRVAGIIAMRGRSATEPLGTRFPDGLETTTMWDLYYKLHHRGDTALVYRTDVLRAYPYEVAPGEKFIAETSVYHQIDQSYVLAVLPEVIWICAYLPDGYTAHVREVTRQNPVGYLRLKRAFVDYSDTFALKVKNSALCLVGAHFAGCFGRTWRELPNRPAALLAAPVALALVHTVFRKRPGEDA